MKFGRIRGRKYLGSVIALACVLLLWSGISQGAPGELEFTPSDGSIFVGKKPTLEVRFDRPANTSTLYILIDDMDVTSIAEVTADTLTYIPPYPV